MTPVVGDRSQRGDLAAWAVLVAAGLALTYLAVKTGAELGTRSAPFLGFYRFTLKNA